MTAPRVALCFLVWNERAGVEFDLPQIDLDAFDEVFAIDGGSTDGTAEALARFGVKVHRQRERGLNSAYWQAVETTACPLLVVFFPKGTLPVAAIGRLRKEVAAGWDMVIPSRQIAGGHTDEEASWFRPRSWGVSALALAASLLWRRQGPMIHDVLHGVKAFSVDAFRRMQPARNGVTIDLEMAVRAYRLRLSTLEFPVTEVQRLGGSSHFPIFPTGLYLLRFLVSELFRRTPRPR